MFDYTSTLNCVMERAYDKIKLNICNIDRNGYNTTYCLEDCIATIAKYENIDYQMMFLHCIKWSFDDTAAEQNKKIYANVETYRDEYMRNQYDELEIFHGIKFKGQNISNVEECLNVIKNELSKKQPVIVRTDSYYLPWDVMYKQGHSEHLSICIGMDKEKIYICDPFYGIQSIELDIDIFLEANCGKIITYKLCEKKCSEHMEYVKKILFDDAKFVKNIQEFEKLANAYKDIFDLGNEYKDFNECQKSLDIMLKILINKSNIYNLLKYIYSINEKIQMDMDEVIGTCVVIKNMLFKGFFRNDAELGKKIYNKLIKIVELDYVIYQYYNDKNSNSKHSEEVQGEKTNEIISSIMKVNIVKYYNNSSFGTHKDPYCKSDFSGLGEFLEYAGIDNTIFVDNVEINVNISSTSKNDNVICKGQIINIEENAGFNSIFCIATSEFGETIDHFKIIYSDGYVEKAFIKVSDINNEPMYGEQVIWRGVTYIRNNFEYVLRLENAHLFLVKIQLKHNERIQQIQLPECENLHIYGITLC